jgi:hypothetical protein
MRRATICGASVLMLLLAVPGALAQPAQRSHPGRDTWYEFLVKQFNPSNFDYGAWVEKRRKAFLEATAKTPYFWYSTSVTAGMLFMILAYTKLYLDHRRSMRITSEMMADLYNHDLYSRQAAKEAIERHNRHIEQCNRAIENAESGHERAGWGNTPTEELQTELRRVAAQLDATTQERNKLQEELQQKSLVVADLSTRLDALSRKITGSPSSEVVHRDTGSSDGNVTGVKFVGHINRLQEELYTERQKNKRLKGA